MFPVFGVGSLQCRICRLQWAGETAKQWWHFVAWFPGQYLIYALFFKANVIRRIRKEVGMQFRYSKLKGTLPWDFQILFFFHESVSPKPLSIPLGLFQIFSKIRGDILSSKCTTGVRWHRWQMEKIFNQKNFNYFVWTPLGRRVNICINFCLQVHFEVSAAWYCSHYLSPVSLRQVAICPPRRWHQRQICHVVIDIGGK